MSTSAGKKPIPKSAPAKKAKPTPAKKPPAPKAGPAAKAGKSAPAKARPVPAKTVKATPAKSPPPARPSPARPQPAKDVTTSGKSTPLKANTVTTAKTAPATTPTKAQTPSPATPTAAAVAKVASPVPTLVPGAPLAMPPGVVPRKGKGTPKYFVAPVQAPLPPPTSRFADRFAPPRPPTRQMNQQEHEITREKHKPDPKLANAWKTKAGRALTDDEVLAMPEAEYMNDKQLDFFKGKLEGLKNDLLSNAGETTEHLREDTSIVPDPADRATIEEEHALELRTRDRERKLLKKISQSLARLESGEYGFCDETGEPIGLGRLIARPTATLSLEAQQRRELKQKMFGD